MTMVKQALIALSALALTASAALAQDAQAQSGEASILDRAINNPAVDSWSAYGQGQRSRLIRTPDVVGERAFRVRVTRAGADAWEVGAKASITGAINQGDVLLLAYWARAEAPLDGGDTATISSSRVELAAAPYTVEFEAPARVSGEWKMYYASGVASRAFAAGEAGVTLHLAAGEQTIDLGPVFVLNFGPDYNVARLPRNE
jgi:hypothetical protein